MIYVSEKLQFDAFYDERGKRFTVQEVLPQLPSSRRDRGALERVKDLALGSDKVQKEIIRTEATKACMGLAPGLVMSLLPPHTSHCVWFSRHPHLARCCP